MEGGKDGDGQIFTVNSGAMSKQLRFLVEVPAINHAMALAVE